MISILLIDDHEVVRIGLRFAIESAVPGAEVAEAGSLAAGLEHLAWGARTDLVLLDPGLPDAGGVSGLQAIREAHPDLPVVMVSGSTDGAFINRCLGLGALGFAPKFLSAIDIVTCVRTVLAGEVYRPDPGDVSGSGLREPLTKREEEIVLLCASGLQNKEIGLRLGISDNTVRAHLVTIFRRFDLTSRADTRTLVQRLGLGESAQG
jgi:DNA-binding NarL/FixJ family response regulator